MAKLGDPLWEDDPILTEQPTDLIDTCRTRFHQSLTDPMEGLEGHCQLDSWFTEGFDTADLQEAKALLDEWS